MKEAYFSTNEEEDIKIIEKIPPLYLQYLISSEPIVRGVSNFTDILIWRNTSKSFIALFIWATLCQWTQAWMIFGLPCFVLIKRLAEWFNLKILHKRRKIKEHIIIKKDLDASIGQQDSSIQKIHLYETLEHLKKIQSFWTNSYWKSSIVELEQLPGYVYVYAWIIWTLLNYCLELHTIICVVGCWLLVSCSPTYQFIVYSLKHNIYLYYVVQAVADYHVAFFNYYYHCLFTSAADRITNEKSVMQMMTPPPSPTVSCEDDPKPRELYRCEIPLIIEIYENERWWLGLNWTKDLLSSERSPWTDNQFRPIISKENYQLPNDKVTNTSSECKKVKSTVKSWVWNDRDWWIDMTGELEDQVDPNGWKYSNNKWQNAMNMPGPHSFTRQRRWCRRAKIIENKYFTIK